MKPSKKTRRPVFTSKFGIETVGYEANGRSIQLNAYMPLNGGAGYFVAFPKGKVAQCVAAMTKLLNDPPAEGSGDITAQVPGALAAGKVARPTFAFGTPTVAHAKAGEA